MKPYITAMLLASLSFALGCSTWKIVSSETILIGGERQMYFPVGTDVPAVSASVNTNGWYSLTAGEMNAIVNP